ncbi:MAG: AraC family transcriptional regulator [Bacteroidales bacterium]|jgi:AraC-like DNA-binding protein|nr:AraC family transcriptional regulator [Bacteroidales bacterium]
MDKTARVFQEITPLLSEDCFFIINRIKDNFTYPVHAHPEFELNYIENAKGAKRIVGNSSEEIDDLELCLIGSESLEHAWVMHNCSSKDIHEITIQFRKENFLDGLLDKKQFQTIATLLHNAQQGVAFSRLATENAKDRIKRLCDQSNGFFSVIEFLLILYELSNDKDSRILSSRPTHLQTSDKLGCQRIQQALKYLEEHFSEAIKLSDVAHSIGMTEISFSRFIKKRTGKTYIEFLNDIRLSVALRNLLDTNKPIADISRDCGFNNLSNFNRMFKRKKGCTPSKFRENYVKMRILV